MEPVFDEEEVKLELGGEITVNGEKYSGASTDEDGSEYNPSEEEENEGEDEEDSEDPMDVEGFADESLDAEGEAYGSSNSEDEDNESLLEEIPEAGRLHEPYVVKHPISQTGFGTKLPQRLKAALELLKEELNLYKEQKPFNEAIRSSSDPGRIKEGLRAWKESRPETSVNLEEQLTAEFLAYAFVKFMLRRQYDDEDDDESEKAYRPRTDEELEFVSDFLCNVSKGENEIYKFFDRLKEHPSFSQYLRYLESLSLGQISTLVWDSSVRAQRIILKLSNLHESALSTLDKIIKINRESASIATTECEHLEARIKVEADRAIQNYGTSELTTSGRRNLLRALSTPYIKSEEGFAAPSFSPYTLPFTFQQLQQASFSPMELEAFQVAVLKSVVETKTARIEDRCSQLLNKAVNNSTKPEQRVLQKPSLEVSGGDGQRKVQVKVKTACSPEILLKWKDDMIAAVAQLSLEDVVNDPYVNINWLSVSANMSLQTAKACTADDCQRLWETVVLPNLKHHKQKMSLTEIQKLMKLVSIYGERNWDSVAVGMGSGYAPFQCFTAYEYFRPGEMDSSTRYRIRQEETEKGASCFNKIVKLGKEFLPDITKEKFSSLACQVTGIMSEAPNIPLQTMAEHYNRFSNPDVQKRSFKLVEDLLLLVCMVKMREYLILDKSFTPLRYYLPWRFVSSWACRADIIFGRKTAVFSREDDLKLLEYAHSQQKFDWKLFSQTLGPDKNRKNTRGRYVRLQRRLKYDSFENIRKEYERRDRNQRTYTMFTKYIRPLQDALNSPQLEVPPYEQLCHNPNDTVLWNYLSSFDKSIIEQTIRELSEIIELGGPLMKPPEERNPTEPMYKPKPVDRRKFIRGDPTSTASAIHLRKMTLKPREEVENMTKFQSEVYAHFEHFSAKGAKSRTERNYLPSIAELLRMAEIHNVLCPPIRSKVNKENPVDEVSLDDNGYPILNNIQEAARKLPPHHRKKKLGWVKAQMVRRENIKRKKLMEEQGESPSSSNPQNPVNTNDPQSNSLEELTNEISVQIQHPGVSIKEEKAQNQ